MVEKIEEKWFEASGSFKEKGTEKKFCKRIFALTENLARDKVFSLFGSKHRLKRRHLKLNELKEVKE